MIAMAMLNATYYTNKWTIVKSLMDPWHGRPLYHYCDSRIEALAEIEIKAFISSRKVAGTFDLSKTRQIKAAAWDGHLPDGPTTSSRLRGVVGCRWHRTGHAGNQLGRPMFSSGQHRAEMMMMKLQSHTQYLWKYCNCLFQSVDLCEEEWARNSKDALFNQYVVDTKSFVSCSLWIARFYNKLPMSVTVLTEEKFKTHIKRVLIKKTYYKVKDYVEEGDVWHSLCAHATFLVAR